MIAWFFDPRVFNYVMIGLSASATVRWLIAGQPWTSLYWASAMMITLAATYGLTR